MSHSPYENITPPESNYAWISRNPLPPEMMEELGLIYDGMELDFLTGERRHFYSQRMSRMADSRSETPVTESESDSLPDLDCVE